jgi:hypothetical protein
MRILGIVFTLALGLSSLASAQTAAAPDVLGEWEMTTVSPIGESTNTVEFRKDGETIKAFAKGPQGERPYDSMKLEGDQLVLVLTVDFQGSPMIITYAGRVVEKAINGSADFGGLAIGSFSATKKEPAK